MTEFTGQDHEAPAPEGSPRGLAVLRDPHYNKGTAFSEAERDRLGVRGLLPARMITLETQVAREMLNLQRTPTDLAAYNYLIDVLERNETLFYRMLIDHLESLMPLVYTPTVGQACLDYSHIFRRPHGLFITAHDRGRVAEILANWPHQDVRVIVVTDGERILGLGDLGANGMGIPIGKLMLYSACAGIHPAQCLPILLDVGTNTPALFEDPLYIGLPQRRVVGAPYDELIAEFLAAVQERFPQALVQLEDFGNANAFRLLHAYQDQLCLFNDDIQGTGAVTLAGIYAALRRTRQALTEQTFVFLGAGEAALGTGETVVDALVEAGLSAAAARQRCWFVDSSGLVVQSRANLTPHKQPFAHDHPQLTDLAAIVEAIRPTVLIGAAGQPGMFTEPVLRAMARINAQPIIFALSNPTSKQECTAAEAYTWTDGRCLFASGSPSAPVTIHDQTIITGQANNTYIFPGMGLGIVACGITRVTSAMFLAAAQTLAAQVSAERLASGALYPPIREIRAVSVAIAVAVAEVAYAAGLAGMPRPDDLRAAISAQMYEPDYPPAD
jgi:malate dehydrogenase (oxaloacetate-decarboxylating)(NADP+)